MAKKRTLTAERLREILDYDPATGMFTWKKGYKRVNNKRAGRRINKGYRAICFEGVDYREHVLAWLYMRGEMPSHQIDHIDLDPANNAWLNLRPATNMQNCANQGKPKNNTSGVKGVSQIKKSGKWRARIKVDYRQRHLGCFDTPEEAQAAYAEAAKMHFGAFARTE